MYANATDTALLLPALWIKGTCTSTVITLIENISVGVQSYIEGKVGRRYTIPFATSATGAIPPAIRDVAEQLAGYRTMRALFTKDGVNVSDWVKELYTEANNTLEEIRKGDMDLANTAGSMLAERDASTKYDSTTYEQAPTFDEDTVTNWAVDPDKLDAISDRRGSV